MSATDLVAIIAAITALLGSRTAMFVQLRRLELRVDGRLSELLELTRKSSKAEGVLEGSNTPSPSDGP